MPLPIFHGTVHQMNGDKMSILYGVNKATLEAYVAAERAKVWEAAAVLVEQFGVYPELNVANGGPDWYRHGKILATLLRQQAKETP